MTLTVILERNSFENILLQYPQTLRNRGFNLQKLTDEVLVLLKGTSYSYQLSGHGASAKLTFTFYNNDMIALEFKLRFG